MKLFILALTFLATTNAFAGSFSLECSNLSRSVKISKGDLQIKNQNFNYHEDESFELMGLSSEEFADLNDSKLIIGLPNVETDYNQNKLINSVEKTFFNQCGNKVVERKFKMKVGIYKTDGSALIDSVTLTCKSRAESGHYCASSF